MPDPGDLLKKAWQAVEDSGVPDDLREAAFREAVAYLREEGRESPQTQAAGARKYERPKDGAAQETTFFARLSKETGTSEEELRQVLHLEKDGVTVRVLPPSRSLGSSRAQQAKTVIALVGGARHAGLGEHPVQVSSIREECKHKNCYDKANFAPKHIGPLKGFNISGPNDLLLNPKWVTEFDEAVGRVLGRKKPEES